ncbi:Oxoglutarate/iron-dependent dioxygenase [Penicillium manginii]|uniref:Oxoglutarate/iron-dependent dioxygenase n=1 Tax=Penicillium manginii TaxID=203109 RepID=UPI002547BAA0|nr:Oxoglutarate/iron-dependent dioxygenase [Penicillium manginii]KAJ5754383.1 Oxoglutarate/iron-dependent dioxygenase [Penicillium manginii]
MSSNFQSIPIIDLSLANSPATRSGLLQQLHQALIEVGFLYVSNHEVPQNVVSDLKEVLPRLFNLDLEHKEKVALYNSPPFLGLQPNRLRNNRRTEALGIPPDLLFSLLSDQHRLKLVHYPPSDPSTDSIGQGVGPHKDSSGWWTFLLQASPPNVQGLQALNKNGDWIDIPVIQDTFVVNIGQAFEVVTHGVCKATTHRVLSEPLERFSVPFFQGVRGNLTKSEALDMLKGYLSAELSSAETDIGANIDSAFLRGKYDTWGESQLRTKIRSHRNVGQRFYGDVFEKYTEDDS